MSEIKLVKPSQEYEEGITEFRQELLDARSDFAGCGSLYSCKSATEWVAFVAQNEKTSQKDSVTSNSYMAVRLSDNKIVGIIELRHHINHPILSTWGGHIGYTVSPSERRKGYAKEMLHLNLQNCRDRGIDRVLLVCNRENIASEKTIIANGGVFETEIIVGGHTMKRFWITL